LRKFLKKLELSYTPPIIAKLTPIPIIHENKKEKVSTTKITQNALKYKAKTLYY